MLLPFGLRDGCGPRGPATGRKGVFVSQNRKRMKKAIVFLTVAIAAVVVTGCHEDKEPPFTWIPPVNYQLSNESGHTVSIVQAPLPVEYDMPDSLVLRSGDRCNADRFLSMPAFARKKVWHDGRYMLDMDELPVNRNFQNASLYRQVETEGNSVDYLFVIGPDDYDYAVERGTDFGVAE